VIVGNHLFIEAKTGKLYFYQISVIVKPCVWLHPLLTLVDPSYINFQINFSDFSLPQKVPLPLYVCYTTAEAKSDIVFSLVSHSTPPILPPSLSYDYRNYELKLLFTHEVLKFAKGSTQSFNLTALAHSKNSDFSISVFLSPYLWTLPSCK
jgi:hypothetical protein